MRLDLISFACAIVSALAFPSDALNSSVVGSRETISRLDAGDTACRAGFTYYKGWCVHTTSPSAVNYNSAVNECKSMGAFSPSIHSDDDLHFWEATVTDLALDGAHFWLDAHCAYFGQPYVWLDGTPTDYYGPANELQDCQVGFGFFIAPNGLDELPITDKAPALCAYNALSSTPSPTTTGNPTCRAGFNYYKGRCVYTNSPSEVNYNTAVSECKSMGAFAPSIHSDDDLKFWETAIGDLSLNNNHFWLDAHCADFGQPYVWLDGTATDYYGPSNELQDCQVGFGFFIAPNGLDELPITDKAPALCAYDPQPPNPSPTTSRATTPKPTTPVSTAVDVTADYCSCNPSSIYLDIVFVVDTSDDMARDVVGDVAATIQSTLYGLTFGTGQFQSDVAALVFAETVQVVRDFGGFRTINDISSFTLPYLGGNADEMADAVKKASSMIYSNGRDFSRGVIVLVTNSIDQRHASNINDAAKAFKDDGGVIITIDYSNGVGIQGLNDIASDGFYINDTATNPNLNSDLLYAFCDANCFCKDGLVPYSVNNDRGREVPRGCFHVSGFSAVYQAADDNCHAMNGFVATVHDDDKNIFLLSLFPVKSRFWIGLRKNGAKYEWADWSTDEYTYWANGNPIAGQDCVYAQQQTGFNSPWFSAPCTDPLKNSMPYACQLRPCGSDFDCWA